MGSIFNPQIFDMLSNLVNSVNALTNPSGSTLVGNTWNVITASAACNAKLPAPSAGLLIGVAIAASSTNLFTLNPNSSETINFGNNSDRTMWSQEVGIFRSDGSNWFLVGGICRPMCAIIKDNNSSQTFSSGAGYKSITLGAVTTDNTGLATGTANTITFPRGGTWQVGGKVSVQSLPGGTVFILTLGFGSLGGTDDWRLYRNDNSGGIMGPDNLTMWAATANDTMVLTVYTGNAGPNSTEANQQRLFAQEVAKW